MYPNIVKMNVGNQSAISLSFGFCLIALTGCGDRGVYTRELRDVSGVARLGSTLLLVDDEEAGVYFRFPIDLIRDPVIPLDRRRLKAVPLPGADLAIDLESIGVLADGRVVVLSERLRALVDHNGIVVEYESPLAEIGKRGLEGLAVQPLPDRSSRIAVLWEGGYPEYEEVQPQLRQSVGSMAMRPLVLVHDLKRNQRIGRFRSMHAAKLVELRVPLPAGEEPKAQRFRAPDLVWAAWQEKHGQEAGFIVLISSLNSLGMREYLYHWLLRFTLEGEPVGEPLDIDSLAPPELKGVNWEGLDWFEQSQVLVAVCETSPSSRPVAMLIPVPTNWHLSSRSRPRSGSDRAAFYADSLNKP